MSAVTYQIDIANPALSGGDLGGFVDDKKLESYGPLTGVTFDQAQGKKRGNFRYLRILQVLGTVMNPIVVSTTSDATNTTEATVFTMVVKFERSAPRIIRDESELEGILAVKQLVAEALAEQYSHLCDVYEPNKQVALTATLTVGALAADADAAKAFVTVTTL